MRLISRSILREIWPPFLLGFAAYTFILLIRTILLLADFAVRRSAPFREVGLLVLLSLPWIAVLTLPMAFLLGVLIGLGRLGADSELTALGACGVGPSSLYRPLFAAAGVASAAVLVLYNLVLPPANEALQTSMARVAATSIVNVVTPRTFREPRPGIMFFFDRVAPDGRSFEGVFLKLGDEDDPPNRVIVARRGGLALEGDRLWLDLVESTVHEVDPEDPTRYRSTRNSSQRLLLAGESFNRPGTRVLIQRGLRSQTLPELWRAAHRLPAADPDRRLAWVEIHKKFAIPFACVAFAFVGVPLGRRLRRGGRGGSFALSLLILLVYYLLLSSGETWAQEGRIHAALAIWLPNALLLLLGAVAILWKPGGRAPAAPLAVLPQDAAPFPARSSVRVAGTAATPPRVRMIPLADRYVLARFLVALALVLSSALLLAAVVDYADKLDEVARHRPSAGVLLGYYRFFLVSILLQISPFAVLLATLVGLGMFSKNNEDTAFKASGVSLARLAAPVLVLSCLFAVGAFLMGEYVLPIAEQKQARYRNLIYGRPPDYGIRTAAERNWYLARDGRIWFREESDPERNSLLSVAVFERDAEFQLVERTTAREAVWDGARWRLRDGWERTFEGEAEASYRAFREEPIAGDPPKAVTAARRRPEEMRFRELERLTRRLAAGGYPTASLETALQAKLAQPALLPIMALLAVPFAFRVGRRGALAGVGVGLVLGILALIAAAFMTKLGEVGALPPALAAWSPNVLFGLAGWWFLLRLRT